MKLMWFQLMPYAELPDNFRDESPSVWVDIDSSLFDPRPVHHMYNEFGRFDQRSAVIAAE